MIVWENLEIQNSKLENWQNMLLVVLLISILTRMISSLNIVAVIGGDKTSSDVLNEFVPFGFKFQRFENVRELDPSSIRAVLMLPPDDRNTYTSINETDWDMLKNFNVFVDFVDPKLVGSKNESTFQSTFERGVIDIHDRLKYSLLNLHKHVLSLNLSSVLEKYDTDVWFAHVAGYDVATYGLNGSNPVPLLLRDRERRLMFTSTRISTCITSRFAPSKRWIDLWSYIFQYLLDTNDVSVSWTSHVSATYERDETLPKDAALSALDRGVQWYVNALMLPSISRLADLTKDSEHPTIVPFPGDGGKYNSSRGQFGVFEGFSSDVQASDGRNPQAIQIRDDCTTETAMAFAMRCRVLKKPEDCRVASNLLSFAWQHSGMQQTYAPPYPGTGHSQDTFGLIAWTTNGRKF